MYVWLCWWRESKIGLMMRLSSDSVTKCARPSSFTEDFKTSDGSALDVDVLCGMLLVSSLCSLCSSATCSAQTCFSLPPLNSLLSERGQRPGTVTHPGGGWRTPHLPLFPERWAVPPLLFILYTPESPFLSWITWQCVERAAVSSFQLYFGLFRWINKCFTGGCMESLCMDLKKRKMELFPFWQRDGEGFQSVPESEKLVQSSLQSIMGQCANVHSLCILMLSALPPRVPPASVGTGPIYVLA